MRILFCNYEYPPIGGGGGVANKMLAEELAHNHEVIVLTSQAMGLPRCEELNGVRIYRVPVVMRASTAKATFASMAAYVVRGWLSGKRLLQRENFEIVNTHFAVPTGPVGVRIARQSGVPNVLTVHGGDAYDPSKFLSPHRHAVLRSLVKGVIRASFCTIVNSQDTANNVRRYYDPAADVRVLPYGIEKPPQLDATTREAHGLGKSDFVMVAVGRLIKRKAFDRLIHVLSEIKHDRFKLLLLGTGPLEQELKALAASLGVGSRVIFKGFVSDHDKFRLLRISDAFVYTSQHEGFGIVFLEALGAGLPVVCYNKGGQLDFMRDGENGRVVPLNDEVAFRRACEELASDQSRYDKMSRAAVETAQRYYVDAYARKHIEIFEAALAAAPSAARTTDPSFR
jgi:glycosyltransferase involved in cell wall biosynthesis